MLSHRFSHHEALEDAALAGLDLGAQVLAVSPTKRVLANEIWQNNYHSKFLNSPARQEEAPVQMVVLALVLGHPDKK